MPAPVWVGFNWIRTRRRRSILTLEARNPRRLRPQRRHHSRHPERSVAESKDPVELTLNITHRDPSTSLGMTRLCGRLFFVVVAILANAIYARAAEVIPARPDRYV